MHELTPAAQPVGGVPAIRTEDPRFRPHVLMLFQPTVGGVPRYVADLVDGLVARNWPISVAGPPRSPVFDQLDASALHVLFLETNNRPALTDLPIIQRLVAFCRAERVEVLHSHSSKAGALGAAVSCLTGIPSVFTPNSWSFERDLAPPVRRAYVAAERLLGRRHRLIVTVSERERANALRHRIGTPETVVAVPTGLPDCRPGDRAAARRLLSLPASDFLAGWVGRADVQKRPEHLPLLARALGSAGTVLAMGYGLDESRPGDDLRAEGGILLKSCSADHVYAAVNALVLTSRWEGLPIVVLEAMRAGLPTVAYDVGAVEEQIVDGVTGYIVREGDVATLAERLRRLADDPVRARRMGEAARERFLERFASHTMLDRLELLLHDVALRAPSYT